MRGALPDLTSAHPIGLRLPGVFLDDDFTQRFVAAFDGVLAPVFTVLDSLDAYLDPELSPVDFVEWLAGWVALDAGDGWPPERLRALVAQAVETHRWRGTRRALLAHLALVLGPGAAVDVTESGGCAWSDRPDADLPGSAALSLRVRVRGASHVDERWLRATVAAVVPAHLDLKVEVSR